MKALNYYKKVVQMSKESELVGQALFNIGMMHHFGKGVELDLEMAQIYYERAMMEQS